MISLRSHSNAGFSLVEVLAALSISAILLLGLAMGLTGALRQNIRTRNAKAAATLAAATIERLRAQDPATLASGEDTVAVDATGSAGGIFSRSWTVTDGYGATPLTRIDVQVTWQDGTSRQLTYSTLVSP